MDEIVSFCGLTCHKCAIYLATREQDTNKKHQMRVEIAQTIYEIYKEKMETLNALRKLDFITLVKKIVRAPKLLLHLPSIVMNKSRKRKES